MDNPRGRRLGDPQCKRGGRIPLGKLFRQTACFALEGRRVGAPAAKRTRRGGGRQRVGPSSLIERRQRTDVGVVLDLEMCLHVAEQWTIGAEKLRELE